MSTIITETTHTTTLDINGHAPSTSGFAIEKEEWGESIEKKGER